MDKQALYGLVIAVWTCALAGPAVSQTSSVDLTAPIPLPLITPKQFRLANLNLPSGRLMAIGGTTKAFFFLDLDHVFPTEATPTGKFMQVLLYRVFEPGLPYGPSTVVQSVGAVTLNCAERTYSDGELKMFDERDNYVTWLPARAKFEPITPASTVQLVSNVVCGASSQTGPVVVGHAAAMDLGRTNVRKIGLRMAGAQALH